jgi:hypothetical protein
MTDVSAFLYESFPAASFGGNIAGVVLLEYPASQPSMQGVAADLGAPTTGFRRGLAPVHVHVGLGDPAVLGQITVVNCEAKSRARSRGNGVPEI